MKIFKRAKLLNDSNFMEDGEYILEEKPKYKYEIKIDHDFSKNKNKYKYKSKTPDKNNSTVNFCDVYKSYYEHFVKNIKPYYNTNIEIISNSNNNHKYIKYNNCNCEKRLYNTIKDCLRKIEKERDNNFFYSNKYKNSGRLFYFKEQLKIEKQFHEFFPSYMNKIHYHISDVNVNNSTNFLNNNIIYITSHQNKKNNLIRKKKFLTPDKNRINNRFKNKKDLKDSLISNDESGQKCNSKRTISMNLYNERRNNINNELIIHKSSDMKEIIKTVPFGKKIKPIILKKKVYKPILDNVQNESGSKIRVIKQTSILTSIETNPLYNKDNKYNNNTKQKYIKERTTNIYTTLSKKIKEKSCEKLSNNKSLNKSFDSINFNKKLKKKNNINKKTIRRKNYIQNDLTSNNLDKSNNSHLLEINNKYINDSINYCSINPNMYEQIEPKSVVRLKEEIKHLKYLYYRCNNLNSKIKDKLESLMNYFLNLSDEEKIGILTNLKNNGEEDEKIYNKLIDILKDKRNKEE